MSLNDIINTTNISKKSRATLIKNYGTVITLTNHEVKNIMKVIKSLENREILIKGTNRKTAIQERGFLIFWTIKTVYLWLMKSLLTPVAESALPH